MGKTNYSYPFISPGNSVLDLARNERVQMDQEKISEEKQKNIDYEILQLALSRSDWAECIREAFWSDGENYLLAHQAFSVGTDEEFGKIMRTIINEEIKQTATRLVEER